MCCELNVGQLVGFLVVEPVHSGSSPRLDTGARIFLDLFISAINGAMLSVVGDVPVDSEAPVATSSISRFVGQTQFFRDAPRDRVCMRVFIGVNVRSCL